MKTFAMTTLVLSFFAGLAACDPGDTDHITTITGRGDAGGEVGEAVGRAVNQGKAGSGSGAGSVEVDAGAADAIQIDPNAAFLGTWRYSGGNISLTCDDGTSPSSETDGEVTFVPGDEPDEIIAVDDSGCRASCKVSGNTAKILANVICSDAQMVLTSLVYTLANGALREQAAGGMTQQGTGCSFTADSRLTQH